MQPRTHRPGSEGHEVRRWLDVAAESSGLLGLLERARRRRLTVLTYHRVLPDEACADYPLPSLVVPASAFEAHARVLAERFEAGPLGALWDAVVHREPAPRPRVAITFDDGYADNHAIAAPILEAAGLRATFFVATEFVEWGAPLWYDEACARLAVLGEDAARAAALPVSAPAQRGVAAWMARLKALAPGERRALLARWRVAAGDGASPTAAAPERFAPMTAADVGDLAKRGHEIGSHSHTHPLLPQLDDAALASELALARERLARWTGGAAIDAFCYPNGDHDERVRRAVLAAGHRIACTTESGTNGPEDDPLALRRVDVNPRRVLARSAKHDAVSFRAEVSGFHAACRRGLGKG